MKRARDGSSQTVPPVGQPQAPVALYVNAVQKLLLFFLSVFARVAEWWELNKRQTAGLLGVSEPTIAKWVDEDMPCLEKGGPGKAAKFDSREVIQWWKENKVLAEAARPAKLAEREQLVDIETKELKLRELKGTMVDRGAAVHVINYVLTQCQAVMRQAPRRFSSLFVKLPDEATSTEMLTKMAEDQCKQLRIPDAWKSLKSPEQIAVEMSA